MLWDFERDFYSLKQHPGRKQHNPDSKKHFNHVARQISYCTFVQTFSEIIINVWIVSVQLQAIEGKIRTNGDSPDSPIDCSWDIATP